jgi:hypothetical protein
LEIDTKDLPKLPEADSALLVKAIDHTCQSTAA